MVRFARFAGGKSRNNAYREADEDEKSNECNGGGECVRLEDERHDALDDVARCGVHISLEEL